MRKRIPDPLDILPLYRQNIISHHGIFAHFMKIAIIVRHLADLTLFAGVHCLQSTAFRHIASIFHLDKYQIVIMIAYNINLALTSSEITLHDPHSLAGQILCCQLFFVIPLLSCIQLPVTPAIPVCSILPSNFLY